MHMPYQITVSLARNEGNKSARAHQRSAWNAEDRRVAERALSALLRK